MKRKNGRVNRREATGKIRKLTEIKKQKNTNVTSKIKQQDSGFELTAPFKVT